MNLWLFVYLFIPLAPFFFIMNKWYSLFWIVDEFMFNTLYWLYEWNWIDFPKIVFTSLSGSGYVLRANTHIELWSVFLLTLTICLISIPLDTFLTNLIVKQVSRGENKQADCKCKTKRRVKWFTEIYSFWRLLLPDFLIAGPLLAWIFKIQMNPKQILRLNITIQLIRAGLFIGFACLYKFL